MKTIVEQLQCKCIHFNGLMNKVCRLGIDYETVKVQNARPVRLPCIKESEMFGGYCDKAEFLTAEQAAQKAEEINSHSMGTIRAALAIKMHIKSTGINSGSIECPSCGGALYYSMAESNGYTRGNCKCGISWIE